MIQSGLKVMPQSSCDAKHYKANDVELALCQTTDVELENHSNAQNMGMVNQAVFHPPAGCL